MTISDNAIPDNTALIIVVPEIEFMLILCLGIQTESQVDSGTNSNDETTSLQLEDQLSHMLDDKCVGAPGMESRERQLPADWIEERFRVDRRKLEEMILGKQKSL